MYSKQTHALDAAVKNEVEQHTLDDQQLLQLQHLLSKQANANGATFMRHKRVFFGAAAVFVIVFALFFYLNSQPENLHRAIAREVVSNHLKLKPLDLTSSDWSKVRGFFTLLDFSPSNSKNIQQRSSLQLLGGRYCSIRGEQAAQLRYTQSADITADSSDQSDASSANVATLYQAAYDSQLFGAIPKRGDAVVVQERGLQVSMWQENALLMVLVETIEN
ncbi:hypothetical protein [Agaribacterium haliotis]|uniref:hypothetical protein n=1 Tax=Agaribacterium haliotis TaxID=2013869 RepID=UPI000BB556E1|nr:hypothetical protein [Agaribacterium haliotis]